jgi:NADH-quinone oxidoreductase subunit J
MPSLLFWLFTAIMLISACAVVINRNPVASALNLVLSFLCLAALFVGLDAFLIGVLQVLVYAGAVMVLFLFIIMLLDLKAEQRRKINPVTLFGGLLVSGGFVAELCLVLHRYTEGRQPFPALVAGPHADDVHRIGTAIFTSYNLPLQVIGVLVLVATVGVVILSRRELK